MSKKSGDYLITGATGNIGGRVVEHLLQAGLRPRVLARDAEKARRAFGERVDVRVGDLSDPSSLRAAFAGVSSVFLVNAGPDLAARDAAAAQIAKQAGIRHLVKLSSMDVDGEVGAGAWHAQGEHALRESGLPATFVRPSGFMSNALWWAPSIKAEGLVRTSTGRRPDCPHPPRRHRPGRHPSPPGSGAPRAGPVHQRTGRADLRGDGGCGGRRHWPPRRLQCPLRRGSATAVRGPGRA